MGVFLFRLISKIITWSFLIFGWLVLMLNEKGWLVVILNEKKWLFLVLTVNFFFFLLGCVE